MTERIEGEFHYADFGAGFCTFHTKHDDELIDGPKWESEGWNSAAATAKIESLDATATHFIQLGEAQALERVNGLAEETEGFAATYNPLTKRWNVGGLWMGDTFTEALESAATTTEREDA